MRPSKNEPKSDQTKTQGPNEEPKRMLMFPNEVREYGTGPTLWKPVTGIVIFAGTTYLSLG